MNLHIDWLQKLDTSNPLKLSEISPEFSPLEPFIERLPDNFQSLGRTIHKGRNEIKIVDTKRGSIVLKYFGKIYLANRFIYAWFRSSKGKRSFDNARRLLKKGIDTPYPIAYIESYRKGLIEESIYVYAYCPSTMDMSLVLEDKHFPDRANAIRAFVHFTYLPHQKRIYHRDYNPSNVLFERSGRHYHFTLIDINRIHFGKISDRRKYSTFSKLSVDEETLRMIAREYAILCKENEKYVAQKIISYNKRFIRKKIRKRALKKLYKGA